MTARAILAVVFAAAVVGCVHVFVRWDQARTRWALEDFANRDPR